MKIIFFLFSYHILLIGSGIYARFFWNSYLPHTGVSLWIDVGLLGLIGGCAYCIRALYIQYCVKKEWDNRWVVWHMLRPSVSIICGVISLLFVKAGLLLFGASSAESSNHYGIYALAFIAGLNVDNFLKKIESVFKELGGIEKTRVSGEK